uniref:Uncharacterized protein n=1 Tax=Oryza glaberrima TaxID=4538 RepID=I1QMN3_ORYGL
MAKKASETRLTRRRRRRAVETPRRAERERRRASVGLHEGVRKEKGQANLTVHTEDKLLLQLQRRDAERAKTSSAAPPTGRVVVAPAVRPR